MNSEAFYSKHRVSHETFLAESSLFCLGIPTVRSFICFIQFKPRFNPEPRVTKPYEEFNHSCVFWRTWYSALTSDIFNKHIFVGVENKWFKKVCSEKWEGEERKQWCYVRVRKGTSMGAGEGVGLNHSVNTFSGRHLENAFLFVFLFPMLISWTLRAHP